MRHAEFARDGFRLIDAARAGSANVKLLQGDDIGLQ